jgi:hypothetical protein
VSGYHSETELTNSADPAAGRHRSLMVQAPGSHAEGSVSMPAVRDGRRCDGQGSESAMAGRVSGVIAIISHPCWAMSLAFDVVACRFAK